MAEETREHKVGRVAMQTYADYKNGVATKQEVLERIRLIIENTAS